MILLVFIVKYKCTFELWTDPSQASSGIFNIFINPYFFNGQFMGGDAIRPTKEFWAMEVIHEIVHTFIEYYNIDDDIVATGLEQHHEMISSWITSMSSLMTSLYGMSSLDAKALALSGMADVFQRSGAASAASWDAFIQSHYNISFAEVKDLTKPYMTGAKGTNNCP